MTIDFLYYEDCPSHQQALERLQTVLQEEGVQPEIHILKIQTEEQARRENFHGSPTIRIDGRDIDPAGEDQPVGLTCRVYTTRDGRFSPLPDPETIRQAVRDHL